MAREQRVVFFDVGNVLIDDDPFLSEVFRLIYETLSSDSAKAKPERFWADLERALRMHGHMAMDRLGFRYHGRSWLKVRKRIQKQLAQRWWRIVRLIPQAKPVLQVLRQHYCLGIIANQPTQVIDCLDQWELLSLFDVVLLDSQYGVAKPDSELFRIAMEQTRVDPRESVMIGDRIDNDVIPARRLGMRAILFWLNVGEKGWVPQDEWEQNFLEILERLPVPRWDQVSPKERPMALVRSWKELPAALDRIWIVSL